MGKSAQDRLWNAPEAAPPEPAAVPKSIDDAARGSPAQDDGATLSSPARLLQARIAAEYGAAAYEPFDAAAWPPAVRLAILLSYACGLWVCLGGLAFMIIR